ncbi:segregation and condensation protein A [Leucobacter soli]|uniref:segregation and condensation protein A n=1 Tax=Leucobacter soli TaxID=2812850 RepID=UPI00360ACDB0
MTAPELEDLGGATAAETAAKTTAETADEAAFRVSLDVFDGPFDLLLSLISKHELDITEVSLSLVTDEFIAYLASLEGQGLVELDRASEFLVVAATLLDLKVASLLPQGEAVDAEDIALLEARDLLFARLLQYRAFKQASAWFLERLEAEAGRHPGRCRSRRSTATAGRNSYGTSRSRTSRRSRCWPSRRRSCPSSGSSTCTPLVSIREQAAIVVSLLRGAETRGGSLTFRELIAGVDAAADRGVIVARFLAILELYRRDAVGFDQIEPLGELRVEWVGEHWSDEELSTLGGDYD